MLCDYRHTEGHINNKDTTLINIVWPWNVSEPHQPKFLSAYESGDTLKPLTLNFCMQMKTHYRTTAYEQLRRFSDESASKAFALEGFSRGWENPSLLRSRSLRRRLLIKMSLGELIRVGGAVALRYDAEGTMHGQWWRSFWRIRISV